MHRFVTGDDCSTSMVVDAVRCWFAATIECPLAGGGFVELTAAWSTGVVPAIGGAGGHWMERNRCHIVVAIGGADASFDRCAQFLFCHVVRPTNLPASSHWFAAQSLHDH